MKYNTVIFDLDGTLLDTSEGIMLGASYTANKMGVPGLSVDQQRSFIGPPLVESFMRECGFSEDEARKAVYLYRLRYQEQGIFEAKQYHQIEDLLVLMNNSHCKTAVATLKREDFATEIIHHFNLSSYFDLIKGIDDQDSLSKTDIIRMCLSELNENDLSKVVMIGDSIYDAMGAAEAGIDFIAVTYGYGFKNKEEVSQISHVFIAESVNDIINYFNIQFSVTE